MVEEIVNILEHGGGIAYVALTIIGLYLLIKITHDSINWFGVLVGKIKSKAMNEVDQKIAVRDMAKKIDSIEKILYYITKKLNITIPPEIFKEGEL